MQTFTNTFFEYFPVHQLFLTRFFVSFIKIPVLLCLFVFYDETGLFDFPQKENFSREKKYFDIH